MAFAALGGEGIGTVEDWFSWRFLRLGTLLPRGGTLALRLAKPESTMCVRALLGERGGQGGTEGGWMIRTLSQNRPRALGCCLGRRRAGRKGGRIEDWQNEAFRFYTRSGGIAPMDAVRVPWYLPTNSECVGLI